MKKTALYVRVSTDAQYEEGYSVDAQLEKLEQYCKLKDYTNYEKFVDGGWSGSNINRPEMQRMISEIEQGKIDTVLVYKLDRLSRSQKDTIFLLEDVFNPHNVSFISLNENFDTTTPYGKAMIGILSVFAQLERENIRERTYMGKLERIKTGLWPGGDSVPFGYDYDKNKGILVPNSHAKEVQEIYELYMKGYSTTRLANMYEVCSDGQIMHILSRVTYLGKIYYNGVIYQGLHEPLIDQELFDKVQEERAKRSTKKVKTSDYLLTGLLRCGKCGAAMRYQKWGKKRVIIYCYSQQTSAKHLVRDPNCNNKKFEAEDIEKIVLEDLFRMTDELTATGKPTMFQEVSALETLRQRYNSISTKIKRLYNLYAETDNQILLETIQENQSALDKTKKHIQREEQKLADEKKLDEKRTMAKNLRSKWPSMNIDQKRQALRMFINKIVVNEETVDIHYAFGLESAFQHLAAAPEHS
ncbi:MAG: recombinase family protein [Clostridiales bacterium]|nr:recombinase family protein [Clostridiales bacterium]